MKKLITLLLLLTVAFSVMGCGNQMPATHNIDDSPQNLDGNDDKLEEHSEDAEQESTISEECDVLSADTEAAEV